MCWRRLRAFAVACALGVAVLVLASGCGRKATSAKAPAPFEEALYDAKPNSEAGKLAARALELRRSRRCAEALTLYRQALATPITADDAAAIRIAMANTFAQTKEYDAAVKEADAAIQSAVTSPKLDELSAVTRGGGAIAVKMSVISRRDGNPETVVLDDLVASASPKERPLYLYFRAQYRGAKGQVAHAKPDLLRLVREYPKTELGIIAQGMLDDIEYGPAGESPFGPKFDSPPPLSPSMEIEFDRLHALALAKKDSEFLPAARKLLPTLPKDNSAVPLLRLDMAKVYMRAKDFANARKEANGVLALARIDTEMLIGRGVQAATLIGQITSKQRGVTEEHALRDLVTKSNGYDRGIYEIALTWRVEKLGRKNEAMVLYKRTAEGNRGTHLAVFAMTGLRNLVNPI